MYKNKKITITFILLNILKSDRSNISSHCLNKTHNQQIFLLMHQFIINNKYFLNINELIVNFILDYKKMASYT